jgi:hypothetical protein
MQAYRLDVILPEALTTIKRVFHTKVDSYCFHGNFFIVLT